ncbi:hypothetical protein, partial [Pseudomonas sp. UBA6310]|uniref:hypothetical protein n=1 Tax=Pseudomonas sp. UBA6310 TaxID=1947327 RepID=UPI00257AABBD
MRTPLQELVINVPQSIAASWRLQSRRVGFSPPASAPTAPTKKPRMRTPLQELAINVPKSIAASWR